VFLAIFGYPVVMETLNRGRTLGKMAVGARVITLDGTPVRFRHAATRSAFLLVDTLLVPVAAIGVVSIWMTKANQRLGDLVAGTIVIVERRAERGTPPLILPNIDPLVRWISSHDVRALTSQHDALARAFLARVHLMSPGARFQLAEQMASSLAGRLGVERPRDWPAELFVAACVKARRPVGGASIPPPPPPMPAAPQSRRWFRRRAQ
jgi:hypothetical protein